MNTYYIGDKNFEKSFALDFYSIFKNNTKLLFFCLGSDKWTVDCFAPIVGTLLKRKFNIQNIIIGDLEFCIDQKNYIKFYKNLKDKFSDYKIIAIDTTLSNYQNIGIIKFDNKGIFPSSAIKSNNLVLIGDYSITANIDLLPYSKQSKLPATKLGIVYNVAEKVASAIYKSFTL